MLISYVPLLVCLIGMVVFAFSTNVKAAELGKAMFWTGLLVTLFVMGKHVVTLGH